MFNIVDIAKGETQLARSARTLSPLVANQRGRYQKPYPTSADSPDKPQVVRNAQARFDLNKCMVLPD